MQMPIDPEAVQPLRKHHFSKPSIGPNRQCRVGGAIFTTPARDLAPATLPPQPSVTPLGRKFWIVPDRPAKSVGSETETKISVTGSSRKVQEQIELQAPPSSIKALPAYSYDAVAVQFAPETPYLVPPESQSERNVKSGDASSLSVLNFGDASERWLESRKPVLKERTFYMYEHHLKTLNKYFADMKLDKIHVGHISDYQRARMENRDGKWKMTCGPSIINHELNLIQQVMKRAKLWGPITDAYTPLPIPDFRKPKVLSDVEERHLFAVAASRPEWTLAFFAAKLTRHTTAAGTELRHLRFEDVILDSGEPRIVVNAETAKNSFRGRSICLNPSAKAVMELCLERARKLGSHLPEHYIFPKRIVRGLWDPYQPASTSWLRSSFHGMREAAGFPWLTPHCFRHMAITSLLEKGGAPETVRHIAGHVSEQMMKHYSHNRHAAQMALLAEIDDTPRPKPQHSAKARAQQQKFMARGRRCLPVRRGRP